MTTPDKPGIHNISNSNPVEAIFSVIKDAQKAPNGNPKYWTWEKIYLEAAGKLCVTADSIKNYRTGKPPQVTDLPPFSDFFNWLMSFAAVKVQPELLRNLLQFWESRIGSEFSRKTFHSYYPDIPYDAPPPPPLPVMQANKNLLPMPGFDVISQFASKNTGANILLIVSKDGGYGKSQRLNYANKCFEEAGFLCGKIMLNAKRTNTRRGVLHAICQKWKDKLPAVSIFYDKLLIARGRIIAEQLISIAHLNDVLQPFLEPLPNPNYEIAKQENFDEITRRLYVFLPTTNLDITPSDFLQPEIALQRELLKDLQAIDPKTTKLALLLDQFEAMCIEDDSNKSASDAYWLCEELMPVIKRYVYCVVTGREPTTTAWWHNYDYNILTVRRMNRQACNQWFDIYGLHDITLREQLFEQAQGNPMNLRMRLDDWEASTA